MFPQIPNVEFKDLPWENYAISSDGRVWFGKGRGGWKECEPIMHSDPKKLKVFIRRKWGSHIEFIDELMEQFFPDAGIYDDQLTKEN